MADRFGVSVQQIVNLNNIGNPDLIYPGQKFKIK
ncbi:MAG: LysM peptidoglycan-binding domain-containing protein [Clostridiales bacterium]|nr:LysM peptidoglycan-binding domain-containing protein [Clostridiales bacterium]MBS5877910.1 LysM peptidoglycan-binding domain-containing protein [Clostridiales bacterium]